MRSNSYTNVWNETFCFMVSRASEDSLISDRFLASRAAKFTLATAWPALIAVEVHKYGEHGFLHWSIIQYVQS